MPKIVAIHSYRGGTGKSNLTANLATAIALQGQRVCVVDTDLQSPGIHNIFGLNEAEGSKTLNDYLWNRSPIEETAHDVGSNLGIGDKGNIFLIPASVNTDEIARILNQGYNVSLLNDGFRTLIRNLKLDYLFIDTHPGLSKETLLSIAISHHLLLVLRPDQQDFQGTAVTVDVARKMKVRNMMLLINKALANLDLDALRQRVETTYEAQVAGVFLLSEDMVFLGSRGLFCLKHPDHPFTQEIFNVAKQMVEF